MENLRANEIAGFGVGALLLCATIAAPKLDAFFSSSQRRKCGDLRMIACSRCKGTGLIKSGGPFGFNLHGGLSKPKLSVPCNNCQSKGCFPCLECLKE